MYNSHEAPGTKYKFGKERAHRWVLSRSVNLMSVVLALQNLRKGHNKIPCNNKDAPAESRGTWRKFFSSTRIWIGLRFSLLMATGKTKNDSRDGTHFTIARGDRIRS